MGTSTNAYLYYGYDLGGYDSDWRVEECEEGEDWAPDWLEDDDLPGSADKHLLTSVGFAETDYKVAGYYERSRAAQAQVGVTIESHCSGDYPMYVLAAKTITAHRGDVKTIDLADLQDLIISEDLHDKLAHALKVLGVKPIQEKPAWLLCSYWSH